ncbi:MAG: two component transcriptional regulator, two-component system, OmpR family, response regulator [Candidatus Kaiserbacteria bacterium]|nr:two component transcriptional regulator, two-component system, OmpR family, response regulator [Candidatus Kaiserbacteria bacterium]
MTETTKANIVLVDDDKFLLDMYSMKFQQQNYNVHAFLSAREALESLRHGLDPQVILFDLTMPECDGFTFLQVIRDEKLVPNAIKIALSNQSTDAEKDKIKSLGADQFIVKATMIPSEVVNTVDIALLAHKSA